MELIRKGQPLKIVFLKYLVTVGFGLVGAIVLALLTFTAFYNIGLIIPANYTENQILENKLNISSAEKFDESLIPAHTSYTYFSSDGEILQSNMNEEIKQKAEKFHSGEEASSPSSSFIEIKRTDGYVVINYQVVPHYTNDWMEKNSPKINFLFATLIIIFCFISTFAVTLIWVKRIKRQLSPMLEASDKIAKQELDFDDFLMQMQQIKKLGPLKNIIEMIPGMPKNMKDMDIDDNALVHIEAIIRSMTLKERRNPDIINASRRKRIASGSGTGIAEVNKLIKQFGEMKKMMKKMGSMSKNKKGKRGMMNFPKGFNLPF